MKILVAGEINPDLILRNYQSFPELGKEVLVEDLELTLGASSAICAAGWPSWATRYPWPPMWGPIRTAISASPRWNGREWIFRWSTGART